METCDVGIVHMENTWHTPRQQTRVYGVLLGEKLLIALLHSARTEVVGSCLHSVLLDWGANCCSPSQLATYSIRWFRALGKQLLF